MTLRYSLCVFLIVLAGCGESYGVKEVGERARSSKRQSSAVTDGRLSGQSAQYLRQHSLLPTFEKSPKDAIDTLLVEFARQPDRSAAFVLAELCYLEGARHSSASDDAGRYFLSSAIFAYAFLFDPQLAGTCSSFDQRYSLACETYNRALSQALARHPLSGDDWKKDASLQSIVGPVRIVEHFWKLPWPQPGIDRFESAYRYAVTGIEDPTHQDGVGVPLIAIRSLERADPEETNDTFLQKTPTQALAASVCVRFHGSVVDAIQNRNNSLTADVSVLDPQWDESIEIAGRSIPVVSDLVTPVAYTIQHGPQVSGFKGLMDTTSWGDHHGLFMGHPYQKGKIPVVFVYGLTGKPTTWTLMYNYLVANETLRSRFQFWYFMYPTGNPVLYSAAELRGQLIKAQRLFDPDGCDPAFKQMVIVGHSMGGLVTRYLVTDSGDALWDAAMHHPFESTDTPDASRDLVKSVFFFKSLPFVTRVVFMATPHRGSAMADSRFARKFSHRVKLSDDVRIAAERYILPAPTTTSPAGHVPTAVQSLSAVNPVLLALDHLHIPQRIKYHSVIANRDAAGQAGGTDSIVPYTSSHLDGAVSETIIHSKHACTRKPDAIREVARILLLHLAEIDGSKSVPHSGGSSMVNESQVATTQPIAGIVLGMAYADIVDILGEPTHNIGFGELHVAWHLSDNRWFCPRFDGDKLIEYRNSPNWP